MHRNEKKNEKLVNGIRELLQQLFVFATVGCLFIFVPLRGHSPSDGEVTVSERTKNPISGAVRVEKEVLPKTEAEKFVTWLNYQLGQMGPGGNALIRRE